MRIFVSMWIVLALAIIAAGQRSATIPPSPKIIAKVSLASQTSSIATTTLVTPRKNTLYRISVFGVSTVPLDNGSFWCVQFNWSDNGGAQFNSIGIQTASNNQGTNNYFPWVTTVEANANVPLTYSVIASGTSSTCGLGSPSPLGSTYDVFFIVEQLM